MEGCKAVNQVSATYQSVDTKQKEYGNGIKIGQWSHELHADVADINQVTADIVCQIKDMRGNSVQIGQIIAMNYEPIEMDSSGNKIVEWIIWHGNGSGKKSKIVRKDGVSDEHV